MTDFFTTIDWGAVIGLVTIAALMGNMFIRTLILGDNI